MSREQRIRRLELQVFRDDDDESGQLTWEEFQILYAALRSSSTTDREQRCIAAAAAHPNLKGFIRKWPEFITGDTAASKIQQESDGQTRVPCHSEGASSPAPTCSSPVLSGGAQKSTASVGNRDELLAPEAKAAAEPKRAQSLSEYNRKQLDYEFGPSRWRLKA
jgi:hypothetical protein